MTGQQSVAEVKQPTDVASRTPVGGTSQGGPPESTALARPAGQVTPSKSGQGKTSRLADAQVSPLARVLKRDSYASTALGDIVDRSLNAAAARFTAGLSPSALAEAWFDWLAHLTTAPGKRIQLLEKAVKKTVRLAVYSQAQALPDHPMRCIDPLPQDHRFDGDAWQRWPYNIIYQNFLLQQQWWHNATTGIRGVSKQHERMVEFTARQILDMFSPSNFLLTNPEVLNHTIRNGGANLSRGAQNLFEDLARWVSGKKAVG